MKKAIFGRIGAMLIVTLLVAIMEGLCYLIATTFNITYGGLSWIDIAKQCIFEPTGIQCVGWALSAVGFIGCSEYLYRGLRAALKM